ncbi:hypothetical protein [Anaerocolumna sp.]|uniref:hypothetical protein n=1 Tax=Anaerocolumna sp. TaxID=2041569 RepID=UPI0028B0B749|nr:hypothetical protein [Anaerocolumna sp.]
MGRKESALPPKLPAIKIIDIEPWIIRISASHSNSKIKVTDLQFITDSSKSGKI